MIILAPILTESPKAMRIQNLSSLPSGKPQVKFASHSTQIVGPGVEGGLRNALAEVPEEQPVRLGRAALHTPNFPVEISIGGDPQVSRQHVTLIRKPEGWLVIDGVILKPGDPMPGLSPEELTSRVFQVQEMPECQIVRSRNGVYYRLPNGTSRLSGLTQILGPASKAEVVEPNDWTRMAGISWLLSAGARIKIGEHTEFTLP